MVKEYVLDANAVLRYLGVVKAEGEPKVRELFQLSKLGEARLLMSVITFGEVYYVLLKLVGQRATQEYSKTLLHSINLIDADQALTIEAATLKHGYKIGYADSFAAALALGRKASLVSADPAFEKFGKSLKWLRLPPFDSSARTRPRHK
jgi:predicted nucleic acid-binding protein